MAIVGVIVDVQREYSLSFGVLNIVSLVKKTFYPGYCKIFMPCY